MGVLNDWQFYAFLIHGGLMILGFSIIKFNDFKHLTADVQDLSKEVKGNTRAINKMNTSLAVEKEKIKTLQKSKKK